MKRRKNFFPTLLLAILSWLILLYVILFYPPSENFIFFIFYFFLFTSVFLTISLLLANSLWGFIFSLGLIGYLLLRQLSLENILNIILLASLLTTLKLFFSRR